LKFEGTVLENMAKLKGCTNWQRAYYFEWKKLEAYWIGVMHAMLVYQYTLNTYSSSPW